MRSTHSRGAKHRAFLLSFSTHCLQGYSGSWVSSSGYPVLTLKDEHRLLTLRRTLKYSLYNMQNSLFNKQNNFLTYSSSKCNFWDRNWGLSNHNGISNILQDVRNTSAQITAFFFFNIFSCHVKRIYNNCDSKIFTQIIYGVPYSYQRLH